MESAKQTNNYIDDHQEMQQHSQEEVQQRFANRNQGRSTDRQNEQEQYVQMGVPMGIPVQRMNMQPGQYGFPQQINQYQHFTQPGMEYMSNQPVISENSQQEISNQYSNQQSYNQRSQQQQQIVLGPDGRQYIRQQGTNNLIPIFPQQRQMMGYQQQNFMQYRDQMNQNQRKQGIQKNMVPPPNLMTISQQRLKNGGEFQYPLQQNQYPYQMQPQIIVNQQAQMMGRPPPGYFQYPSHPQYPPQPVSGPLPTNAYHNHDEDSSQPSSIDWQKKFLIICQRFEIQYRKFEAIRQQYQELCSKLETVDSQDQWNDLKQNHSILFMKLNELTEQMMNSIMQNQHLAGQTDQEYEQSWQHRYNQLLQDYKNMRNELDGFNQNQQRQPQAEAALQQLTRQYEQLERNHSQLINQYNNLVKQIKQKDLDFSSGKDYENKLQDIMEENMRTKQGLVELQQQNENLRDYIQQMQQQKKRMQKQYNSQFNQKISKQQYNQALSTIREQSNEINKLRSQKESMLRNCNRLGQQCQLKDIQIQKLKQRVNRSSESNQSKNVFSEYNRILQMKSQEINQYKQMLQNLQEDFRLSIQDCQVTITKKYQDKISSLNKQIKKLSTRKAEEEKNVRKSEKNISNFKIDSYEKKINYYEQQVNNLNNLLSKKNQELIELRGQSFEIEKAKNMQADFENVKNQRDQLKQTLKTRNKQIEGLKASTNDLETKIKIVSQKSISMSSKAYIDDFDNLNVTISKKEAQILKIRQVVQNKQNIIQQLQSQVEKQKLKIFSNEKKFQLDKESLEGQINHLQNRNNDLEKKIRHLQFDYGDTMKNNLEQEINTLRSQNQLKQETIARYQNEQIELNGKITNLQRAKKNIEEQTRDLRQKLGQYERWKSQYNKYMENAARQLLEKDEQIKALQLHDVSVKGQFSSYKAHATEIENTLKTKNQIIKDLQSQIKSLNEKLSSATKDCQNMRNRYYKLQQQNYQETSKLNAQIKQKQLLGYKQKNQSDSQSGSLTRIIDILKDENERLKRQLARSFDIDLQDDPKNSRRASQGLNYIQQRLWQFNSKLEQMVGSNTVLNQDDKRLQAANESNQIQALKQKVKQLQQYCASLQVRVGDDAVIQPNPRNAQIFVQQQQQHSRQINFFKQKCAEFENRAEHLLKVNQQLKARVENLLKPNSQFSPYSFYREQLLLSQQTIEQLNQKVRKLTQENRNSRKQSIEHHSKVLLQKEEKIYKLQSDIQSLNRTIKNLQLQKTSLVNEKTDIIHQINQKEHEFSINEATLKELIQKLQMKVQSKGPGSPKKVTLTESPKKQKPTYSKIKVEKVEESQSQVDQFSPQRSRLADELRTVL